MSRLSITANYQQGIWVTKWKSNMIPLNCIKHQIDQKNDETSTDTVEHPSKEEEKVWMQVQLSTVIYMISQPGYLYW